MVRTRPVRVKISTQLLSLKETKEEKRDNRRGRELKNEKNDSIIYCTFTKVLHPFRRLL